MPDGLITESAGPEATHVDVVLTRAHPVRGDSGQVIHEVIKGRGIEPGQRFPVNT